MTLDARATADERGGLALTWSRLFVRALAVAGVNHVVVSPGSRSTPLALAIAEQTELPCDVVVDERCAGFFALGIARATGKPVVLVCTSGTAAAHYFPAVIEANMSGLPLVIVTADRPWELHEAGAMQTIDQSKLFGAHVRHAFELGVPDPAPQSLRAVMRLGAAAVARALAPAPGPVHVNAHFRKPLEPVTTTGPLAAWEEDARTLLTRGPTRAMRPEVDVSGVTDLARTVADELRGQRGLIVCGPASAHGDPGAKRKTLMALARATGFAVASESTSQVRFGPDVPGVTAIPHIEDFFSALAERGERAPEVILQLGEVPTSASYARWLGRMPSARRIVVSPRTWADPDGDAAVLVASDPWLFAARLAAALEGSAAYSAEPLIAVSAKASDTDAGFDERAIARGIVEHLDALGSATVPSTLMVANSRSIRAMDAVSPRTRNALRVLHQRGASGIDGLIAGAAGARRVLAGPLTLLIGDLAALHDIGGLAVASAVGGPLPIVIANNGGGQIFSDLPIARAVSGATLERFFLTPTAVDFASAAKTFGLAYARAENATELERALTQADRADKPVVIEAIVTPDSRRTNG